MQIFELEKIDKLNNLIIEILSRDKIPRGQKS